MGLGTLIAGIDEAVSADPPELADRDTIVELHRQLARLEAVATRAAAAFDAGVAWQADGARTAAAWLSARCSLPQAAARRRVWLGRALRHLPACEEAWTAGNLTGSHVGLLAAARTPATEQALARDENLLVNQAKALRFGSFAKVVSYWSWRADPDGAERSDEAKRDSRRFHLSRTWADMWAGDLTLDPISGAIVSGVLKRIDRELFEADWAEAKERTGREPAVTDLARTPAQRRADALVEMATRAASAPTDARRPEPLFSVLVGWETLSGPVCELADGTVLAPGTLAGWLDRALLERVVFDSPSRVIDVGVARRLFTGATRRAVELRDRHCTGPFCEIPSDECEIDHVVPWAEGGPTSQDNGRVACGFHNRAAQKRRPPGDP